MNRTTFTLDPLSSPYPCYHLFSPHGGTAMITDSAGDNIAATCYDAFGNTTAGVTGLWYGYTGKYERYSDGVTGAIEMGVREYEPVLGRFISAAPLKGDPSDPLQRNRYPFVGNNPLVRYDLNGLYWGESYVNAAEEKVSDAADYVENEMSDTFGSDQGQNVPGGLVAGSTLTPNYGLKRNGFKQREDVSGRTNNCHPTAEFNSELLREGYSDYSYLKKHTWDTFPDDTKNNLKDLVKQAWELYKAL